MFHWLSDHRRIELTEMPFPREYLRLKHDADAGRKSFLSAYGAANEAEFFSVATEEFFARPLRMKEHTPDRYRVLVEYYRQDPAERVGKETCTAAPV